MRTICVAVLLLGIVAGQANAQTCWKDSLRNSNGQSLALASGQIYRIYPGDGRITAAWLPLDKLTVCPIGGSAVEITNASQKGQQIKALRSY